MSNPWLAGGSAAASALVLLVTARPVLRSLPEPSPDDPDATAKVAYADLARPGFVVTVAALGGVAAAASGWLVWGPAMPLWLVLSTVGVLLAAIDGGTTWLPLTVTRVAWGLMGLAGLVGLGWAAEVAADWPAQMLRTLGGAVAAGGLYLVVWLVSRGGFGFGDVRFAPLIGAAAGAESWSLLWSALVLGSVVGGVVGLVRLLSRRRGPFPYAPAMLTGAYLALALPVLGR